MHWVIDRPLTFKEQNVLIIVANGSNINFELNNRQDSVSEDTATNFPFVGMCHGGELSSFKSCPDIRFQNTDYYLISYEEALEKLTKKITI